MITDQQYNIILQEYRDFVNGCGEWVRWPQTGIYNGVWDVIPLWLWPEPIPHENQQYFKRSCKIIEQVFPGHRAVGFSRMAAGTEILPHYGDSSPGNRDVLRYHLGIDVPDGDTALVVGDVQHQWENGIGFTFDDHELHSAYNRTERDRVILIVDYVPENK